MNECIAIDEPKWSVRVFAYATNISYCTAQSINPMIHPRQQNAMEAAIFPP